MHYVNPHADSFAARMHARLANRGFSYKKGDTEFTTPAPSQSTWDTAVLVLTGAAIAIGAVLVAQSNCRCREDE